MKNELINIDLCTQCKQKCCEIYYMYRSDLSEEAMKDLKLSFFNRPEENWYNVAFERYGVYPLYESLESDSTFCEFYDNSIGCIIEREKMPIICRTYACEKLQKDFTEKRYIFSECPSTKTVTKYEINELTNKIIPTYEIQDENETQALFNYRYNICIQCDNFIENGEQLWCTLSGCGFKNHLRAIFPIDTEGKCIRSILQTEDIKYIYMCKLKKW